MPVVEKVSGGLVYIRSLDQRFGIGDRADVDDVEAEYLVEDRGDFKIVDGSDEDTEGTTAPFDPGEFTVPELKEELGEGSQFTLDELGALAESESDGKDRDTALGAIRARMDDGED